MELIIISETKLKLMLDDAEMHAFDITGTDFPQYGKRILSSLFHEAKKRCGFDATGGRVLVQMYPCRQGGCELFVTKLPSRTHVLRSSLPLSEEKVLPELHSAGLSYMYGNIIYQFPKLCYMLDTCACLFHSNYQGSSAAYHDPAGVFYLFLNRETYFANENFGKLCPSSRCFYIQEHCKLLCAEAVPVLGQLA